MAASNATGGNLKRMRSIELVEIPIAFCSNFKPNIIKTPYDVENEVCSKYYLPKSHLIIITIMMSTSCLFTTAINTQTHQLGNVISHA